MATKEAVLSALSSCKDPEIGKDIVSLGMVQNLVVDHDRVRFDYVLTTPACPLGPVIIDQVTDVAGRLPGVENVNVEFVWQPPWDPRVMASEEAKAYASVR